MKYLRKECLIMDLRIGRNLQSHPWGFPLQVPTSPESCLCIPTKTIVSARSCPVGRDRDTGVYSDKLTISDIKYLCNTAPSSFDLHEWHSDLGWFSTDSSSSSGGWNLIRNRNVWLLLFVAVSVCKISVLINFHFRRVQFLSRTFSIRPLCIAEIHLA